MHVGNDIVDLGSPSAQGKNKDEKFIRRVFTDDEKQFIARSDDPDGILWRLWAAKETAYKVISKSNPGISSAPRKYQVCISSPMKGCTVKGIVKTPDGADGRIQVTIYHYGDVVHCIGSSLSWDSEKQVIHGVDKIDDGYPPDYGQSSQYVSDLVRHIAGVRIAQHVPCDQKDIHFSKTTSACGQAYPIVQIDNQTCQIDISFSHDGRFVAYAFSCSYS